MFEEIVLGKICIKSECMNCPIWHICKGGGCPSRMGELYLHEAFEHGQDEGSSFIYEESGYFAETLDAAILM